MHFGGLCSDSIHSCNSTSVLAVLPSERFWYLSIIRYWYQEAENKISYFTCATSKIFLCLDHVSFLCHCGHKHMTSISELIYIVLFRSHALLTQVTLLQDWANSCLASDLSYVMWSRVEQIFLMKEKKVNGCKINHTFWTNKNCFGEWKLWIIVHLLLLTCSSHIQFCILIDLSSWRKAWITGLSWKPERGAVVLSHFANGCIRPKGILFVWELFNLSYCWQDTHTHTHGIF